MLVERFVLAQLTGDVLNPARLAAARKFIRRARLDLTGLPPSPAAVHPFLSDISPEACELVVYRLFASPHYGERRARHC